MRSIRSACFESAAKEVIVRERSGAEMPVVIPCRASIGSVNATSTSIVLGNGPNTPLRVHGCPLRPSITWAPGVATSMVSAPLASSSFGWRLRGASA